MKDRQHDVGMIALAMFGATALAVGLPQRVVWFPGWFAALVIVLAALGATWVICAVEDDVTPVEAGVAAAIAIPICAGVDWFAAQWAPRDMPLVIAFTIVGAAGAAWFARGPRSSTRVYRVLFSALVAGGVVAALVLLGLALNRRTGAKLDAVPHVSAVITAALLVWRAPQIGTGEACGGIGLALLGAGLTALDGANPDVPLVGAVVVMVLVCGIATGIGGAAHHWLGTWHRRRSLATARVHERDQA